MSRLSPPSGRLSGRPIRDAAGRAGLETTCSQGLGGSRVVRGHHLGWHSAYESCPRSLVEALLAARVAPVSCRRTKVMARLPGETSCLSLVWAVLDLFFSHASNGATFTEPDCQHLTASGTSKPTLAPSTRRSPPPRLNPGNLNRERIKAARDATRPRAETCVVLARVPLGAGTSAAPLVPGAVACGVTSGASAQLVTAPRRGARLLLPVCGVARRLKLPAFRLTLESIRPA
jgi:hypothetical protein